jgi:hypothetical protein
MPLISEDFFVTLLIKPAINEFDEIRLRQLALSGHQPEKRVSHIMRTTMAYPGIHPRAKAILAYIPIDPLRKSIPAIRWALGSAYESA